MNDSTFSLEAGQRYISSEVQDFLNTFVMGLPNWKWLSLIAAVVVLYFVRFVVLWILTKLKKAENYFPEKTFMHFFLEQPIEKGLSWVIISTTGLIFMDSLELTPNLDKYLGLTIKLFLSINVIRTCYLAAEAFGLTIEEWAKTTDTKLDDQLAPFANKTLKVIVVVVGGLIILQNFGVNVTALLAGLGIGGIALAFAAQDTVSNVFGTITILLDSPFKLGDWIKIGDTEGTVIEIGFRSTHIKTFYNSVVTLPNSVVAKEKIDNLSERNGWMRFRHTIGFTYEATPEMMQAFSENLKYQLLQDPNVDRERIAIHFNSFGDSALNVIVNFHYHLDEGDVDLARINSYLDLIYKVATEQKLSFAFPTRTMIMQQSVKEKSAIQ
ncbi:mechanosensitive ion channel family protein [bacterium]|nr:mechanosensitive ion channel family protein [bacterium]